MSYQPPLTHPVFFNGTALNTENWQTGTNGVAITRIEGWFDAPDVRDVRELNSGRDGELADNLYLGGRTITIQGVVSGSTYADLQTKKTALTAKLVPSSSEYVLKLPLPSNASPSWTHADTMTDFERVNARVIEGVQFGDNDGPLLQEWVVTLRASDPLVYSDTLTTVDSGTTGTATRTAAVTNSGTYASPGSIVVTGPTASTWEVSDSDGNTFLSFENLTLASTSASTTIDIQQRTITSVLPYSGSRLIQTGINSLWMVDETTGTTADNAEGTAARDGTYTGGFTLNQTGPQTGLKSVDLNGTTGYIAVAYSADLWGGIDYYTDQAHEFWFNTDALSGTQTIFDSVSGITGIVFQLTSTGQLQVQRGRAGALGSLTTVASGLSASTWYQLIYIVDEGSFYIYLDGVLKYSGPFGHDGPTATGFRVGARLGGTNFFNGKIGPFGYWRGTTTDKYLLNRTTLVDVLTDTTSGASTVNTYGRLVFGSARFSSVDTGSTTYSLISSGLNTGSKLSIQYRNARL